MAGQRVLVSSPIVEKDINQRWFALLIAKLLFSELFVSGLTCKTKSFCNEKSEKRKTFLIYIIN